MNNQISWGQTIAAAIASIVVFFLLLYFVAPIIESLLNLFGKLFVPERYGGGSEVDNPGILKIAFHGIIASGLSAYGAFAASFSVCSAAHAKTVAVVFGLAIATWVGIIIYAGFMAGVVAMPLLMVFLGAAPALFVAYWAWRGEF
jgi:hypothetical protein